MAEAAGVAAAVRQATGRRGADVVLDTVGGVMFRPALDCLAIGGRLLEMSVTGAREVTFNLADFYHNESRLLGIDTLKLDLTASALLEDPTLAKFAGRVSDSGEGRLTINAAIDEAVPAHVLTAALYERFSSRGESDFANKLLSAMRYEFGGHVEKASKSEAA